MRAIKRAVFAPNPNAHISNHFTTMHMHISHSAPHQFNEEKKQRYIQRTNVRTHHINIFNQMETNAEWRKKITTKYQCYFGDSLRARKNDDNDNKEDDDIREKIYRSISLVCILCIHIFVDRSTLESAIGRRLYRLVYFIVLLDERTEKSDKQSHYTIVSCTKEMNEASMHIFKL